MPSVFKALFGFAALSVLLTAAGAVDPEGPFIPDDTQPGPMIPRPVPKPKTPLTPETETISRAPHAQPAARAPDTAPVPAPAPTPVRPVGVTDPVLKATPSGPAQPVISSSALNVTATPTTRQTTVATERRASKPAAQSLLDVKAGNTTVTISPTGVIRTRNPDVDVDAMKVAQMIAQFVQTISKIVEAGKSQSTGAATKSSKSHGTVSVGPKGKRVKIVGGDEKSEAKDKKKDKKKGEESDDDNNDDGDDNGESDESGESSQPPPQPPTIFVQQKVTIHHEHEHDADGAREQPFGGDDATSRPFIGAEPVDDAKPFARKLPFRVRRNQIRGASSVGRIDFEGAGAAPILMQLQAVAPATTIPRSDFAADSFRFTVQMDGAPRFVVELPGSFEARRDTK